MALRDLDAFGAGELDPSLYERTDLDKYRTGLAVGRNAVVAKSSRLISRPSKKLFKATKTTGAVRVYSPPHTGYLLELGDGYVRVYNMNTQSFVDDATVDPGDWTVDELWDLHIETSGNFIYFFKRPAGLVQKFDFVNVAFVSDLVVFGMPIAPTYSSSSGTGDGPTDVDYEVTFVVDGQESLFAFHTGLKEVNEGDSDQHNTLLFTMPSTTGVITEMRVYKAPKGAGAFGYIGSSTAITIAGGDTVITYTDFGGAPNYAHNPPVFSVPLSSLPNAATGCIYQQRLLLAEGTSWFKYNPEAIHASRVGYQNNFSRDFPLSDDSSLTFKAGTSGTARVLRMIDSDGLVVFTTIGLFLNTGPLSPTNLALANKGQWVIDENVPPLKIPGGVLFVDKTSNCVRLLQWSLELNSYSAQEISIFSSHLLRGKKVVNWAFQEGDVTLIWVVLNDGTFLSLTFERDQQMQAWTRNDSRYPVEDVATLNLPDQVVFVTNKNGQRYLEITVPRYSTFDTLASDPEAIIKDYVGLFDMMEVKWTLLNDSLDPGDVFQISVDSTNDSGDVITLTSSEASDIFLTSSFGALGTSFRIFDDLGYYIDLVVIARDSDSVVHCQVNGTYEGPTSGARIYLLTDTFSYTGHLDGEAVSVVGDGNVMGSPLNNSNDGPSALIVPASSTIVLPQKCAVMVVGTPVVSDVGTLDIDTVEQRTVLVESKIVNKVYVRMQNTRGLYAGPEFPDLLDGMVAIDSLAVNYDNDPSVVTAKIPQSRSFRAEVMIQGDWKSQGRICLRQVDPLHYEILSIIPDVDDQIRGQ